MSKVLKRVINKYKVVGDDLRHRISLEDNRILKNILEQQLIHNEMLLIDLAQIETDLLLKPDKT